MRTLRSNRGSVLIVALIFAGLIALSLTSYLKLASTTARLANRSFYANAAQNLVDTGIEQALWSINNNSWTGTAGFALRRYRTDQYQGTFPSSTTYYTLGHNVQGQIKVWVDIGSSPYHAVSQAILTLGDGTTLVKMAEVYASKRSYFNNGLVAKDSLTFVGNVQIDAWSSDPDASDATAAVAYSSGVATDAGQIASLSVQVSSISVGNADVYGYASVGGSDLSSIKVGSTGRLGPYGTANGTIDPTRVTYDFTTNFPDVTTTTPAPIVLSAITGSKTLPGGSDSPAADGNYYYSVPSISINGGDTITISSGKNVVITVTDTTGTVVKTTGNAEIDISPTASLVMYASADVAIGGNGVVNGTSSVPNQPIDFQLYGTRTATAAASVGEQDISIKGNGYLSAVVYAPNGNVAVNGNGDTYGAIVCNQASMNGNGNFHYDMSLANTLSTSAWQVSKWRELTSQDDRNDYYYKLNF